MSKVKSKNTRVEIFLQSQLRRSGLKFQKHCKDLPGTPDIVFRHSNVAVFVDGEFWHGKSFKIWKDKLPKYWRVKIESNIRRDRRNFSKLRKMGWKVVRLWEKNIYKDPSRSVQKIFEAIER